MASISDGQPTKWGEVSLTGRGLRADVDWGITAGARSSDGAVDPLSAQLASTPGLRLAAQASIRRIELTASGGRGGPADAAVVVDLGEPDRTERKVVLVEENGRFAWFFPEPDARSVELPVEVPPGARGAIGDALRRVVRVVAAKTIGPVITHVTGTLVGAWDERRHPYRLRTWTPENFQTADVEDADARKLAGGPALLVIHGFVGSIAGSFAGFDPEVVRDLHAAYGGRTLAFDHQTLTVGPDENVRWLLDERLPKDAKLEVDILAHSRGGLVARELARRGDPRIAVRSITFVATPNDGTPFADPERPEGLLDALTNLIGAVPGSAPLEMALELVKDIVLKHGLAALRGLIAMQPNGDFLRALNRWSPPDPSKAPVFRAIAADFEPRTDAGIVTTARDKLTDLYFGGVRNDLVVPTLSTFLTSGTFHIPPARRLVLDSSRGIDHSTFWSNDRAVRQLRDWLRPDALERPPPAVSDDESDPGAEAALPPDPARIGDLVETVAALPAAARKAVEELVGGPIDAGASAPTGKRPAVIVVPGIMGSHLRTKVGGDLIWIDPFRLARGQFQRLALGGQAEEIEPAGLVRSYLPLVTKLAASWDVYLAPFDWRADIRQSAAQLSKVIHDQGILDDPKRTVHLVAHSMGGLVCRALALEGVDPDLWRELGSERRASKDGRSGRLIMLGTPNTGSFSIPLTLSGTEIIMKALAGVDLRSTNEDLVRVVASFPGVYQMLPSWDGKPDDDDHRRLFDAAAWGSDSPVQQGLLDQAKAFHARLRQVEDPDRMVYVAGYGHPTPFRIEVKGPGQFSIGRSTLGDGRVPHQLGLLTDVPTYFSTAMHGSLPADAGVLAAIDDLLEHGKTARLPTKAPELRGVDSFERPVMVPADGWDPDPFSGQTRGGLSAAPGWREAARTLDDALRLSIGGGVASPLRPRLRVRVVHAGLEFAEHPVVVGHYAGLPAGGAEAALDQHLDGALRQRQRLGLYPEEAGTAILVPGRTGHRIESGLVLGLGNYGEVTQSVLTQAMKTAVLDLLLNAVAREGTGGSLPDGISSVLIGVPGRHGLSLTSSLRSQVEGLARAMIEAREGDPPVAVADLELEFIECYEYRAENAVQVVQGLAELLEPGLMQLIEFVPNPRLEIRGGARPGAPPVDESGESWVRIGLELLPDREARDRELAEMLHAGHDPDAERSNGRTPGATVPIPIRTVRFTPLTRGAQANVIEYDFDVDKVNRFVDEAVRRAGAGEDVTHALYEMLFPNRSKLDLDPSESLHLLVDEDMAQLPWELLTARARSGEVTALALRAGMLRQLQSTEQTRERAEQPVGLQALVIGDPPTAYPRLPGARSEARKVAAALDNAGWAVTSRVYDDTVSGDAGVWMEVLNALHANQYRAVHIAAHGVFDDGDPQHRRSGVIIGPEDYQRITALDFRQMSVTPDLVFLNCCHLGKLGTFAASDDGTPELWKPHRVAGTVARQLLQNGVDAVIVAGWAVDDVAGAAFAMELYGLLLGGVPLGDAVFRSRLAARAADGGRSATWGAYQCYGDPGFQLVVGDRQRGSLSIPASAGQLGRRLSVLATWAGDAVERGRTDIAKEIDGLRAAAGDLFDDAAVLDALARVYAELGDLEEAVVAYDEALHHTRGRAPLSAAEQLVNTQVHLAVGLARAAAEAGGGLDQGASDRIDRLFSAAERTLTNLTDLAGHTAERFAIRGRLHKKLATIRPASRGSELALARDAYEAAWGLSSTDEGTQDPYHANLWLQLSALTRRNGRATAKEAARFGRLLEQVRKRATGSKDYWDLAALADTLVTAAVVHSSDPALSAFIGSSVPTDAGIRPDRTAEPTPTTILEAAGVRYVEAFRLSSTVRERASSIDHITDLMALTSREDLNSALTKLKDDLRTEAARLV